MPVREYAGALPQLARELPRMAWRARRRAVRELPPDVDLASYPDYFRRNFHWQTDGYLSHRSAKLYDLGVEFLFLRTADVMRRQVIPPLSRFTREAPGPKRVLDVGCGTGRALYQMSLAHPQHEYSGVDLSPFYLERAGELLAGRRSRCWPKTPKNCLRRMPASTRSPACSCFTSCPSGRGATCSPKCAACSSPGGSSCWKIRRS